MPFETLCNEVLTLAPGESRTVRPTWAGFLSDRYGNRTSLSVVTRVYDVAGSQEKYLDSISHDLGLLDTNFHRDEFITVRGNDFVRYGKPWYPVGMNYWPSYVAGLEPGDYNAGWLKPAYYDPAIVERDLVRMKSLGINMVSIQTGGLESQRNLLDFLNRCRNHAIRVNAFIGGAQPTDFREAEVAAYIKAGKLDQNPTIFSYDIIWEPGNWMFNAANRPKYDADWQKWIIERYGSIAIAEAAWGMPTPRTDGKITSPSDAQLREDGTHRIMVAAYRRFMDDFTSAKWNDATRRLRRLVPNQLISFRQGNTLPHDFALTGPVKHIDFICPEGYSIPPGEKGHDAAGFITRYVNFTTRGKPIIWSEFGQSVWDATQMQPDENAIQRVSDYHELFYKVVLEAGANGTAPWWWPGGYRVNERSDFGVMNADGTPRPIAELIKKYSPLIQTPRTYPAPDRWLTIDRDSHAGGYWRLAFNEGAEAYGAARKAKKHLGVRTVGTGTTSANVPPIRIGNAAYGPLKYLNAEFNWLQIKDIDGKWIEARDGVEIRIRHNGPVQVRASVGNTQEATWLAKQERTGGGLVFLAPQGDEGMAMTRNINTDVPYLGDADLGEFMLIHYMPTARKAIALQMYCDGRGWFGEKRDFVLVPVV